MVSLLLNQFVQSLLSVEGTHEEGSEDRDRRGMS